MHCLFSIDEGAGNAAVAANNAIPSITTMMQIEVEVDESLFFHCKAHQGQANGNTAMGSTAIGVQRRGKNAGSARR